MYTTAVIETSPQSHDGECKRSFVYRAASHPNGLVETLADEDCNVETAYDIFQRGLRISKNSPCLGKRQKAKGAKEGYAWWTYGEIDTMAQMLGSGIIHGNLVKTCEFPEERYEPARSLNVLGIISKNRLEWFITEQAANAYNLTLVPMYTTLGEEALRYVMTKTRMQCIAASEPDLVSVLRLISDAGSERFDFLKSVILFDTPAESTEQMCKQLGIGIHYWLDVMDTAKKLGVVPPMKPSPAQVQTICYTSGTTGIPKGVLITHKMFGALMNSVAVGPLGPGERLQIGPEDVHISYLPLAHVFERAIDSILWYSGGRIAIYGGEPKELMDDIKAARPTVFVSVPRLFMRIYDKIMGSVQQSSRAAQYAFNLAVDNKLVELRRSGRVKHGFWDATVFSRARKLMGSRLRYMLSGGAALEKDVQEKLSVVFSVEFLEGYGATEGLGAMFISRAGENVFGHIGGPLPSTEFALESVSHMPQYNPLSSIEPAGQLVLRGPQVMPGYFLDPVATKEAFTSDGFLRTGDIAIRLSDCGRMKIIDRVKNLFKLSQGEYVAPERLELIYSQAPLVSQLFIHGDDKHNGLVAIVCVDNEALELWQKEAGQGFKDVSLDKLKHEPTLMAEIKKQLMAEADKNKLTGFEKLNHIYIWDKQFSPENSLLTPTLKLKRNVALQEFASQIQTLLAQV
eukprot:Blabericola_migrator_1__3631@NODE_2087_length_3294_cov_232_696932_g1324_i0_p1_GENE_NODE_2087_length_3294_cov_232_696932_g1324_i0NODE_2087_length_3294_cov_232_696932_g1324_i0_p1_ORF_typecomplete_len684_score137_69AMPbinding/PF00501_28/2e79_NODE_2087_length_3294_cov_232_696932_g1324_i04442495